MRVDGGPRAEIWDKIAGLYRCGDGRWVRLHTNFPHHRDGVLKLLGCDYDARGGAARAAMAGRPRPSRRRRPKPGWSSPRCARSPNGTRIRRAARSPACRCSSIERIGDAPPQPLPPADRPLAGVRVLDLTRVIAGPGVRAHARGARRRRAAGHRRAPAADDAAGDRHRARQALDVHRPARAGRARHARGSRCATPTSSCRAIGRAPSQANGFGPEQAARAAARHRLRVALRLWPRRPVGGPARLRLAGAERQRHQPRRGRSGGHRRSRSPCPARRSTMRPAT